MQQCSENIELTTDSHKETFMVGYSLAKSLYDRSLTILLSGELGAGKTTLIQGLAEGIGITKSVTSPTYALENRYGDELLHADLYRLDTNDAKRLVDESENFPGVRVVEWVERLEDSPESSININITEPTPTTRTITITFRDVACPNRETIERWRTELKLPEHINTHCDVVGSFAKKCGDALIKRGMVARPELLQKAGELHDLLRFVDFSPEHPSKIPHAHPIDEETQKYWNTITKKYSCHPELMCHPKGVCHPERSQCHPERSRGTTCINGHEFACSEFLLENGYSALAKIIAPHALWAIDDPEALRNAEQKILFYSDKRVLYDRIVSLDERFDDFMERYGEGVESEDATRWRKKTKELERELFGTKIPS